MEILSQLNEREIAVVGWGLVALVFAVSKRSVRVSIGGLIRAFFATKIITPILIMGLYSAGVIYVLWELGVWGSSSLKDSLLWYAFGSVSLLFDTIKSGGKEGFFKSIIYDNVKIMLLVEFLANAYSFSLPLEVITLPFVALVAAVAAYSEMDEKYASVKTLMSSVLVVYGAIVLFYSAAEVVGDLQKFMSVDNLRGLIVPPILSVAIIPYLYLVAVYAQYENVFVRLKCLDDGVDVTGVAKRKLLMRFHVNLKGLVNWSKGRHLRFFQLEDLDAALSE